ncbi:MAG: hypothetical protein JO314_06695 [Acidobacteria bacterium]|nr:hypothetical protein [Acidobacteriota bacterium]
MGVIDKILRRKKVDPDARRRHLLAHGRITDGVIIDSQINGNGQEVVLFTYTLNGVDFESYEILTPEQRGDPAKYAPGAKVGIRYDQKNQGNSIVE